LRYRQVQFVRITEVPTVVVLEPPFSRRDRVESLRYPTISQQHEQPQHLALISGYTSAWPGPTLPTPMR